MKNILIITIIIAFTTIVYGQNPFFNKKKPAPTQQVETKETNNHLAYPNFVQKILNKSYQIQKELNFKITNLIKENSSKSILLLFLFSFIYGIVHALGPGHGKAVVTSYFVSNKSQIKSGIFAGALIAFIHSISAIIITGSIYLIIKKTVLANFEDISLIIKKISFSTIMAIGLFLFLKAIYELIKKRTSENPTKEILTEDKKSKSIFGVALTIGIVPCPGAAMILLFTINYNLFAVGVIAVLFMSIGMALTISIFAIATILLKNYSSKIISSQSRFKTIFFNATEIIGSLMILLIGFLLFKSI